MNFTSALIPAPYSILQRSRGVHVESWIAVDRLSPNQKFDFIGLFIITPTSIYLMLQVAEFQLFVCTNDKLFSTCTRFTLQLGICRGSIRERFLESVPVIVAPPLDGY